MTRVDDGKLANEVSQWPTGGTAGFFDLEPQDLRSAIEAYRESDLAESEPSTNDPFRHPAAATGEGDLELLLPRPGVMESGASASSDSLEPEASGAAVSSGDWKHPATRRRQQILMVAMSAIAATLLALSGLAIFLTSQSSRTSVVSNDSQLPLKTEATVPSAADPVTTEAASDQVPPSQPDPPPPPELPPTKATEPATPSVTVPPEGGQTTEPPATAVPTTPDGSQLPSTVAPPASPSLETLLTQANDASTARPANGSDGATEPDGPTATPPIPESMLRLSKVFDPGSIALLSDALTSGASSKGEEAPGERVDLDGLYHPSAVPLMGWNELRERSLPRLSMKNPSVGRLLQTLGQFLGTGFAWDMEATRWTDVLEREAEPLDIRQQTIDSAIRPWLAQQRIAVEEDADGLPVLRPQPSCIEEQLPSDWSIADLSQDGAQATEWKEFLKRLFPQFGSHWEMAGSTIEWKENATMVDRATLAAFLDQVRIARGLSARSKFAPSLVDPRLGLDALDQRLFQRGTRIVSQTYSVSQFLDLAARDAGLTLFLDWKGISAHGFSHAATTTSILRQRHFVEIVKPTLDEFSLVAVADGPWVCLTTRPRQRRMWRTLVMPLPEGMAIEKFQEAFRILSPTDEEGRSMYAARIIPANGASKESFVAIRICPPNTQQLQNRALRSGLGLPDR